MEIRPLQRASSWRWLTCHVVRPVEWPAPALRALSRVHPAHRLPGRPLHVPAPGSTWVRCVFGRPRPGRGAIPRHVALPVTVGAAAVLRLPVWPTAPAVRLLCQCRRCGSFSTNKAALLCDSCCTENSASGSSSDPRTRAAPSGRSCFPSMTWRPNRHVALKLLFSSKSQRCRLAGTYGPSARLADCRRVAIAPTRYYWPGAVSCNTALEWCSRLSTRG